MSKVDGALGDFGVRINTLGYASRRWASARNAEEAERRNQGLSERRARNVGREVEEILKSELPNLPIAAPWYGLGDRFAVGMDDNAEIDRCVLVNVEWARSLTKLQPRPPKRLYVPSTFWTLRVKSVVPIGAGVVAAHLKVGIRNPVSSNEITLAGHLGGGGTVVFSKTPSNPSLSHIGKEVTFITPHAMDFQDWSKGVIVRLGKYDLAVGLRTMLTYMVFTSIETAPQMLVFDQKRIGLGLLKATAFCLAGFLSPIGPTPSDIVELPSEGYVETSEVSNSTDGMIITFPTGKSHLYDLSRNDRRRLREFVVQRARNIAAMAKVMNYSPEVR